MMRIMLNPIMNHPSIRFRTLALSDQNPSVLFSAYEALVQSVNLASAQEVLNRLGAPIYPEEDDVFFLLMHLSPNAEEKAFAFYLPGPNGLVAGGAQEVLHALCQDEFYHELVENGQLDKRWATLKWVNLVKAAQRGRKCFFVEAHFDPYILDKEQAHRALKIMYKHIKKALPIHLKARLWAAPIALPESLIDVHLDALPKKTKNKGPRDV